MGRELMAQRVLRDVDVVARAGLDVDTFLGEALDSVSRAVPHVAACVATVDPSTLLLTGTHKFGTLTGQDKDDHEWGLIEYGTSEPTAFMSLARREVPAAAATVADSNRVESFMVPNYGFTKELRAVFRDRGQVWGGAALFRDGSGEQFGPEDVELLASLSPLMSIGMRAGLLARIASTPPPAVGPAVVVVGHDDEIVQLSAGAEERLLDLVGSDAMAPHMGILGSLVGAARRFATGELDSPPRCRVRSRSGLWLVLHATPLSPRGDGAGGDVVITIDEARPPEIVPLVVAAFDLTPREREVTALVLQGVDTKEIASSIHVSTYTVQDHLKSVFDKAGVRSRRELIARIYFDQYVPRMGTDVGATGWFAAV